MHLGTGSFFLYIGEQAMTFDELWKQIEKKQPDLKNDEAIVEFKARHLRLLLSQVYEQGKSSVIPKQPEPTSVSNPFSDMFGGMFGGRFGG